MTSITAPARKKLSPRRRAQRLRWTNYTILGLVVLAVVLFADGRQLQSVFFRPDMIAITVGPVVLGVLADSVGLRRAMFIVPALGIHALINLFGGLFPADDLRGAGLLVSGFCAACSVLAGLWMLRAEENGKHETVH